MSKCILILLLLKISGVTGIDVIPNLDCYQNNFYCRVEGSTFEMSKPNFAPDYIGQPAHGAKPYPGISLVDMTAQIGSNTNTKNTFRNMNAGIVTCQSHIDLYNSVFNNIAVDTAYHEPWHGSALVSLSGQCALPGTMDVKPNTWDTLVNNSYRGAYTDNSSFNIHSNKLYEVDTAMHITKSNQLNITITANEIKANSCGIYMYNNAGAQKLDVLTNTIYAHGSPHSTGIRTGEPTNLSSAKYRIFENTIRVHNGQYGIIASAVNGAIISYNMVEQYTDTIKGNTTEGIVVDGCTGPLISCNTITASNQPDQPSTGIRSNVTTNANITCNTVKLQLKGIYFGGFCNFFNDIKGNAMDSNEVGLYLNGAAVIGTQKHKGNLWLHQDTTAARAVNQNINQLNFSQFIVHTGVGTIYHPKASPASGWFVPDSGGTPFSCATSQSCVAFIENDDASELRMVAEDSTLTSEFVEESRKMAESQLFDTLATNDSLRYSEFLFSEFYNSYYNTPLRYLNELRQAIILLNVKTGSNLQREQQLQLLITNWQDSIVRYDSLFSNSIITYNNNLRQGYIDSLNNYLFLIKLLQVEQKSTQHTIIDSILVNVIAGLEADNIPDANNLMLYKAMLLISRYGLDTVNTYMDELNTIAQQCPYSGGNAVYGIRNILESLRGYTYYDDDLACANQGIYKQMKDETVVNYSNDYNIKPNPARNEFTISLQNPANENTVLLIYNLMGKVIGHFMIAKAQNKVVVNVETLGAGLYYIQLQVNTKNCGVKKLVIVK